MKTWETIRNYWLAAALASSSLVLLKLTVTPPQKLPQLSYSFPAAIPLSRWEFVKATSIGTQKRYTPSLATSVDDLTISGQQYRYLRQGRSLDIEMRYFNDTYTKVSDILEESTINNTNIDFETKRSTTGSYAVYQRSNRLYFSACIPVTRDTTVTDGELRGAQTRPDILMQRVFPWFIGRSQLRDLRCLWTNASLPIDPKAPTTTRQDLEQAWTEWIEWWQQNYPSIKNE